MASARAAALHALIAFDKGRIDRLRGEIERRSPPGRELSLAFELGYGVLRRERLLDFVLEGFAHRGLPKDPVLRCALRLGAYQLLFTGGIPAHASVGETVALVRANRGFANALLRRLAEQVGPAAEDGARGPELLSLPGGRVLRLQQPLPADEVERLSIQHSLPGFLVARWLGAFGRDAVEQIGLAAGTVPAVFLRRDFGADALALGQALAAEGVETAPTEHPTILRWTGGRSPFETEAFRRGRFVVQDPTAFVAAEAVPCGPGDTVLDLCAAPGTKTTWLAGKVRPGGRVLAFDPDETRRWRIRENVARLQLGSVVQVVEETAGLPPAQAVLADVPCSNTGVLGRRVEVRRRLLPETFARMAALQREVLRQALGLVEPGGHVVYSTCSIEREENEGVVEAVLGSPETPASRIVQAATTLPLAGVRDGGFCAVLRRQVGPDPAGPLPARGQPG